MKQDIMTEDKQLLDRIAQILYEKKGRNILALDVREISSLTEYYVIAEGNVERHVSSLAKSVVEELSSLGFKCYLSEGYQSGGWVVLDFGHVIVHLFHPDLREHYAFEEIWRQGEIVDLKIVLEGKGK
jgi:ribosome-associated protein